MFRLDVAGSYKMLLGDEDYVACLTSAKEGGKGAERTLKTLGREGACVNDGQTPFGIDCVAVDNRTIRVVQRQPLISDFGGLTEFREWT